MKVRQAIAAALAAEGVQQVFGLMGDGNMHLVGDLVRGHGMTFTNTRHETPAVLMADAFTRLGGGIGIATVTYGPGLAAAGLGLRIAQVAGAPIMLIVGDTPRRDPLHVHSFGQELFVHGLDVPILSIRTVEGALTILRRAFQMLRAGKGPVVLSVAVDVQEAETGEVYRPSTSGLATLAAPDALPLRSIADLLNQAKRPILLAGRGAHAAVQPLEALAERSNALLATTIGARGLFHRHARSLGVMGGLSTEPSRALLDQADLVVAFGASLNRFTTDFGKMAPQARWALVTDGAPSGLIDLPQVDLAVTVIGDALLAAQALLPLVRGGAEWMLPHLADPLADVPVELDDGLDPRAVVRAANAAFAGDRIDVIGVGQFGGWPAMHAVTTRNGAYVAPWEFGAIGVSVPMALGAAAARPDLPVLAWEGDGSLMTALGELETLGRMGARVIVLVLDDGAYGAEVRKLPPETRPLAMFGRRDLAGVARALGVAAATAKDAASLLDAMAQATAARGPFLVHAHVDPAVQQNVF